jgi:GNAT superfamily N-acetyltransferase
MQSLVIRRACVEDWEMFYPFLEHDRPIDLLEAAFARFSRQLESESQGIFVAILEHKIVGIAMAHVWDEFIMSGRKQVRFSSLYVHPDFQRLGIGRALFECTRAWAQSIGATWFEWYASQRAVGFYERLGYIGSVDSSPEHLYFEITFIHDS